MPFFFQKRKKSDECTKEELKGAGVHMQVLRLFFQQCARDGYSDQFQCRLALPIDQPSLVSNIRAKPEPCNLQLFEIDQGIERSDGQSWKDRVDVPTHTHTHKKKNTPIGWGEKSVQVISQCAQVSVHLFFLSLEMNGRPPALPSTPLPCSKAMNYQCL